ncbi:MAG: hypothetical protein AAGD34_09760 [Pseudomonadota bacterium]
MVIHIGHPKTGTASLQATFQRSADVLARNGLYYETVDRNQQRVARAYNASFRREGDEACRTRFLANARKTEAPLGLFSSELLIRLTDEELDTFLNDMHHVAQSLEVLVYARHPIPFADSAAHQGLRTGKSLERSIVRPTFIPFAELLPKWVERVGRENVTVRPFDRAMLTNGDVIDDVLTTIGAPEAIDGLTRMRVNEGLSAPAALIMDKMVLMHGGQLYKEAVRAVEQIKGPRYVLPPEAHARVMEFAAPHLAYLKDEFGLTLKAPKQAPPEPHNLSEAEIQSLAVLLLNLCDYAQVCGESRLGRWLGLHGPFSSRRGKGVALAQRVFKSKRRAVSWRSKEAKAAAQSERRRGPRTGKRPRKGLFGRKRKSARG